MATKNFNARISLKYDSYANWIANDPVLLVGEVAIATIPTKQNGIEQVPVVVMKVGDGTKKYSELQFVSGLAADIYDWAKAATKPSYTADEITGLSEYISGQIQDTNTQYQIVVDAENPRKFQLQSHEKGVTEWTNVGNPITIPASVLETGTTNGTVKFNGTEVAVAGLKSAAYTESTAYDEAGAAAAVLGKEADDSTKATVYGARALASAKVGSVGATANAGIEISGTATVPTVGIKLDPAAGNAASLSAAGLLVTVPAGADGKSAYQSAQDGGYTGTEEQFNRDLSGVGDLSADVQEIEGKIPSAASSTNKLVSASEMGDAIEAVEAKQLYATAQQGSFATKAALTGATTYYNADGTVATPTKNDVAYVLADESHDGKSAKYVVANKPTETVPPVWGFVISFSDNTFSQAQMDAINSGVTSAKRAGYDSHVADGDIHVTAAQKQTWNGKYTKPSDGIPKSDLASSVQTSLGKADSALQQHQSLAAYRTASAQDTIDNGKVAKSQGAAHAGEFLVVGSDGNVKTMTLQIWQGGSY